MTVYSKAKRAKDENKTVNKRKVAICLIILIIMIVAVFVFFNVEKWKIKEEDVEQPEVAQQEEEIVEETPVKEDEIVNTDDIPETMGKYKVLGQLVIDKFDIKKNILDISEDESLKQSVAKFYGPELNEAGNFCITGHNWKSMLKRMLEIQAGDTLYTINKKTGTKINYQVYKTYTCVPEDLSCLDQNEDGKRELTIITCNPGGTTRMICKARET